MVLVWNDVWKGQIDRRWHRGISPRPGPAGSHTWASWRVVSGALGAGAEVPTLPGGPGLLHPEPKEETGSGASPGVQERVSCPVPLNPAPPLQSPSLPTPAVWPRTPPQPRLTPRPPSLCAGHVISQTYQAFPTPGPWPLLFPLPEIPVPLVFPWLLSIYHPGLSWTVTSSERLS